jgi:iron complex outermembrane receptor protein
MDLGRVRFGEQPAPIESPVVDGAAARLQDAVDQWGLGVSYRAQLGQRVKLNVGVLRTDYRKAFRSASGVEMRSETKPWLYNIGAAWTFAGDFEIYGSANRGLEEAGVAPATATNANEVLNAIEVTQQELGIRYLPSERATFVAAGFDTRKPYVGLDSSDGAYRSIGQVQHRGLETSFSGKVSPRLKVVLGAVYLDATLRGSGVNDGRLGTHPVGVPKLRAIANADHEMATVPGLSFDIAASYVGDRAVRSSPISPGGEQLEARALGNLNIGARYRFTARTLRMTARIQLLNAMNAFGWEPSSAETLNYNGQRRLKIALTAEF